MKSLKICLVGDAWSIHTRRWARWLKARGHFVAILSTTNVDEDNTKELFKDDYDYFITAKMREGPMGYLSAMIMVRSAINILKPDIVHGLYLTSGGFLAALSGHKNKIVSAWGSDIFIDAKTSKVKRYMVKYAMKHSKMVFASSIRLHDVVTSMFPSLNTSIVRFGPNMEKFRPMGIQKYKQFTFLSIRKSNSIYNILDIIKAFENVSSGMDARLLIQRPDSKDNDILMAVWNSPMKEKMGFWDERPHEDMPELYGASHVGISIPRTDGCSSAVIECMACGTPVIMPYESDIELVEPILAVRPETKHEHLEDKLIWAYKTWNEKPEQMTELGRKARMIAELYGNFDINMQKAEKCYYEVLE